MKPRTRGRTKYDGITKITWPSGKVTYEARAPWWRDASGTRHDPMQYFDRLEDARDWRNEQLGDRARGVKRPTGRVRLGEYMEEWIEAYAARRPGNTAARYRYGLNKLRPLPIWRAHLAAVGPNDIARAYDALSPEKVVHVHDALHKALADAVPRLIGRNPATGAMRGRKHDRAERLVWTEEEYRTFLAAAAENEMYVLWLTLGQTGARRGEALGLDWPDLDLKNAQLTIRRQYTAVDSKLVLKDVKTARGRRTIEIDDGLAACAIGRSRSQPVGWAGTRTRFSPSRTVRGSGRPARSTTASMPSSSGPASVESRSTT